MAAAPGGPLVPDRPIDVFCGTWKRCLSSRVFGTFSLARDSNTVVHVEQVVDGPAAGAGPATYAPPYGSRPAPAVVAAPLALGGAHPYRMRWSFGRSPDAVRAGYTIEPLFEAVGGTASGAPGIGGGPSPSSSPAARVIPLRVSYGGSECLGTYQQELGLLMAHLVGASGTATIIYRVIDEDTLAVSITEVPAHSGSSGLSGSGGGVGGGSAIGGAAGLGRRAEPTIQYGYMFRLPPAGAGGSG